MTTPLPKLSRLEQETIISWNAQEKTANIYSSDPTVIRRLTKRLPGTVLNKVGLGIEATVPKSWVKIPGKPRQRSYSKEHLEALRAGLKKTKALKSNPATALGYE